MPAELLPDILMVAAMPLLLTASAFFSGSETALFSLSGHQRVQFERDGTIAGRAVTILLARTRPLLITILMGNMSVNVLYFVTGTVLVLRLKETHDAPAWAVTIMSIAPLLVLILTGEVLPKLAASRMAGSWSRWSAAPLLIFHQVAAPIRLLLDALLITPTARLIAPRVRPTELSADELGRVLELSAEHGVLAADEESLLQGVLHLSQIKVRDIMTPRVDIIAVDLSLAAPAVLTAARQATMNHLPAYRGDLDHITGLIDVRPLLLEEPKRKHELLAHVRNVDFVPELMRCDALLRHFRKRGTTFAVVVDEYGGTAGVVTLVDVVEEMIGDLPGAEPADAKPMVQPVGEGIWRVSGKLPIHDWAEQFGRPMLAPGVSTVSGLVTAQLGRIPKVDDEAAIGNVRFRVEKMDRQRIESLIIQLDEQLTTDDQPQAESTPRDGRQSP